MNPVLSSGIIDDASPQQRVRPGPPVITYTGNKVELFNKVLKLAFHTGKDGGAITRQMAAAPDVNTIAALFHQYFGGVAKLIVDIS